MKKLLALLLILTLVNVCLGFALAEETTAALKPEYHTSGDYVYIILGDGTAEIFMYAGRAEVLTIPDELDGIRVTGIGEGAFSHCPSLAFVTIPDSVTSIEGNPFIHCEKLTDIIVSIDHPYLAVIDGILFSKPDKRLVCYPYSHKADKYTIPNRVQTIGDGAFFDCTSLTSVTIPDSVTSIGDGAFCGCASLTSITIPDSVTVIGINPFFNCSKLTDIVVSADHPYLATIDGALFSKRDKRLICYPCALIADSYVIPDGIQAIGNCAFFDCDSLTSVTIPDSVTSIGYSAFDDCDSLTSVTIPDNVTSIGNSAFSKCKSLISITIPDSVTGIGSYAFYDCESMASITIPDSVIRIGDYAFSWCISLMSVTIPDSVTGIGDGAFSDCPSLTSVTIPDSVTGIGENAFAVYQDEDNIPNPALTVTVSRDSYAAQYCKDNGIKYTYPDANDWLND